MCCQLMSKVNEALSHLNCGINFWIHLQLVLRWITSSDLHLTSIMLNKTCVELCQMLEVMFPPQSILL